MKQNPSILFHFMGTLSIFQKFRFAVAAFAAFFLFHATNATETTQPPPYAEWFDPAKGFGPAQPNFTKIFLQLAGSLEYYGTPEPYIRHIMAEHARIDALHNKATGKSNSSRPDYLTDAYLENLIGGWNKLTPVLKLDNLCRQAGRDMRYAIQGGWNKSVPELAAQEANLTDSEKSEYRDILLKQYFTKADFSMLESFYKTTYDKLSDDGKHQLSQRVWLGQMPPDKRTAAIEKNKGGTMIVEIFNEHQAKTAAYFDSGKGEPVNSDNLENALIAQLKLGQDIGDVSKLDAFSTDALLYSHEIEDAFEKRFEYVKSHAKTPDQAERIHIAMISMAENLVVIAHSEFIAALREQIARNN